MSASKNALSNNNPVYNSIWYSLRRISYNAEERVPVIDQPYVWLFMSERLHRTKCMSLMDKLSYVGAKLTDDQFKVIFKELNTLTSLLQNDPVQSVKKSKTLPITGLHYSALIESIWSAAADRVTDKNLINGITVSAGQRSYFCECWLQDQLTKETYDDLLYSGINQYDRTEMLNPLQGNELHLVRESIPKALELTAKLKSLEPITTKVEGKYVTF